MNLIVISTRQLAAVYGTDGQTQVAAAVLALHAARQQRGLASDVCNIDAGMPALAVAGAAATQAAVTAQLRQIDRALRQRGQQLVSVCIVGGPEIVPFAHMPNPVPDFDGPLLTDWPYGTASDAAQLADWSVGRLPGEAGPSPAALLHQLAAATAQHQRELAPGGLQALGYTTATWLQTAQQLFAAVGDPAGLLVSPPVEATTLAHGQLAAANLIYCNLHGVAASPNWFGQAAHSSERVVALHPADLNGLALPGSIVVSQACYGAAVAGQNRTSSLALAFLAQGATAFVGATALSYGLAEPPIGESDVLVLGLLQALARPGANVGAALQAGRAALVREAMQQQGHLDDDDLKTLLTFVLYGDPTLEL